MQTFAALVNAGSFVNAADALDMSKAAVLRHINELESRLGVRLLQRTTRRLSLTQEGEVFYARCEELLAQLDEAESETSLRTAEPSGLLKNQRSCVLRNFTFGRTVEAVYCAAL